MEISISLDPAVGMNLAEYINEVNLLEGVSIHCDVMRTSFVGRDAITLDEYHYIMRKSIHPVDVHLMLGNISDIVQASSRSLPRSICFHVEAVPSADMMIRLLNSIKRELGIQAGLAIDLNTPVDIDPNLLCACDVITIMSVKAGRSGQVFDPRALEKVIEVKQIAPNARIIMDGGINAKNIAMVKDAGVDTAVAGSYVYAADDRSAAVEQLRYGSG